MTDFGHQCLPKADKGFTLVEILISIVLMLILAAVAAPLAVDASDYDARSASEGLAADLEYAQTMAIVNQTPVTISFDLESQSYSLSNASGALVHPIDKSDYVVDLGPSSDLPNVTVGSADFGGDADVTFDVLGAPSAAGAVTIQAGTVIYTVRVLAATGLVSIEE